MVVHSGVDIVLHVDWWRRAASSRGLYRGVKISLTRCPYSLFFSLLVSPVGISGMVTRPSCVRVENPYIKIMHLEIGRVHVVPAAEASCTNIGPSMVVDRCSLFLIWQKRAI